MAQSTRATAGPFLGVLEPPVPGMELDRQDSQGLPGIHPEVVRGRMNYSVAMAIGTNERAVSHLLRGDGQEDACFGLYMPSQGSRRFTGLVTEIVLPEEGERIVRGNVHVATHYFVRVLGMALKRKMGIAIMHSHPSGSGWQASSEDDANSENTFAHTTQGGTGLPLLGMTLSGDEMWSSRAWVRTGKRRYESVPCEKVRVIGSSLNVSFNPELLPAPRSKPELTRDRFSVGRGRAGQAGKASFRHNRSGWGRRNRRGGSGANGSEGNYSH